MPEGFEPGVLSLLPAAVTIVLAFTTRQVIASLFAGVSIVDINALSASRPRRHNI